MELNDDQSDPGKGIVGIVVTFTYDATGTRIGKSTTDTSSSDATGKPLPAVGQNTTFVHDGPVPPSKQKKKE